MATVYVRIYLGESRQEELVVRGGFVSREIQPDDQKRSRWCYRTSADAVLLHCLLRELTGCENCRRDFLSGFVDANVIRFNAVVPSKIDTIDYNWNEKLSLLVRERCELDHTLSWLSTLGGAFSALGDYFTNMAETAGKISMHQFQLAMRLGDPGIASRCRLYFSLSLIQQRQFRIARRIIEREHASAQTATVRDERLIKMCLGIWSKLQYEWRVYRKQRT